MPRRKSGARHFPAAASSGKAPEGWPGLPPQVQINPGPTPEEKRRTEELAQWRAAEAARQAEQERAKANAEELAEKAGKTWYKRPFAFGGRTSKIGRKFDRCVKSVRKTVRARKGSTKESAAIAICTKTVLQTRGRTLKRYKKGRLTTQKRFRGGRS
jgi:hypothetical protein